MAGRAEVREVLVLGGNFGGLTMCHGRRQAHGAKVLFEKYFMWKARNGHVRLP